MILGGDTYRALSKFAELLLQFGQSKNEPFILRLGIKDSFSDRVSGGKD
jgi:hypothetical protein